MSKLLIAVALFGASHAQANVVEEWFIERWCDLGHIYNFVDFACKPTIPWTTNIATTQRTTNSGGYNLKSQVY